MEIQLYSLEKIRWRTDRLEQKVGVRLAIRSVGELQSLHKEKVDQNIIKLQARRRRKANKWKQR
jgi:hypothetical protein